MNEQEFTPSSNADSNNLAKPISQMTQKEFNALREMARLAVEDLGPKIEKAEKEWQECRAWIVAILVTYFPTSDSDDPPFGFDEPLRDILARDRFLHAVRRRREIEMCLMSRL